MSMKCNAVHCINYSEHNRECSLDISKIKLKYNPKIRGVLCTRYYEARKNRQALYQIIKVSHTTVLVVGNTNEGTIKYIESVLKDIDDYNNMNIIFDDILKSGINASNRFHRYRNSKLENVTLPRNTGFGEKIRKITYEYLYNNPELLLNSALTPEEKRNIVKGIYL